MDQIGKAVRLSVSPRLAWIVSSLGVFLTLAILLIGYRLGIYGYNGEIKDWYSPLIGVSPVIAALLVGGLIAARIPQNLYGWIWISLGFGTGVLQPGGGLIATNALSATTPQIVLGGLATHLASIGWVLTISMIPLALILYPTGRVPSPGWRWVTWMTAVAMATTMLLSWAIPGTSGVVPVVNPFGVQGIFGQIAKGLSIGAVFAILFVAFPASVLSLLVRYRRAKGVHRVQLRWLVFAAVMILIIFLLDASQVLQVWVSEKIMTTINNLDLIALPIAVAIAILRYRLYDIDVIIRKTLIYTSLTVLLALVYFGGVVVLQEILSPLTGLEDSPLVIVISTLGVAALFTPLRRRVQEAIDRRFFRRKYQAEQVLADFARAARDEPDLEALTAELERVVRETIQPERIGLWIKPVADTHRQPPGGA